MRYLLSVALAALLSVVAASPALAWTDGGAPLNLHVPTAFDSGSTVSEAIRYNLAKISTASVSNSTMSWATLGRLTVTTFTAVNSTGFYFSSAPVIMTGRLTAPDATLTYGLTAATGSFSGSVTVGSMTTRGTDSGILVENGSYGELIKAGSGSNRIGVGVNAGGAGYCGGVYVGGTLGATFCNGGLRLGSTVTNPPANTLVTDVGAFSGSVTASSGTFGTSGLVSRGPILAPAGSDSAPSFAWEDSPNSGFYRVGAARIGLSLNGSKLVQFNYDSVPAVLDVTGNAQFGTTAKSTFSATGQLKVANGTTAAEDALIVATNTNDRGLTLTNTSGSDLFKVRRNGSSDSAYLQLASVGATKISFISGTGASYINNSGAQLGIGTDSPCSTCTLHVAGGASVTGAFAVASATFTVATTGIVSAPSQPGAVARLVTGFVNNSGAVQKLHFGDAACATGCYNKGGVFGGSTSSGTFTARGAGVYLLGCTVVLSGHGATTLLTTTIADDDSNTNIFAQQQWIAGTTNTLVDGATGQLAYLADGQALQCNLRADSASVTINGSLNSRFTMMKVW